ncbi:MAG: pyridoxal-phosphate dependent enzyme [Alphaproteobacteria bacterium]|nr:pyridoxal-phosphate dependent enzyme [Alphaproteobacteria bacterium]
MDQQFSLPAYQDIVAAAKRLKWVIRTTPLIESVVASTACDARVFLKAETLQHTGSFKFRGAYNLIYQLSAEQRAKGVVAYSSGNHAQAVAKVASLSDIKATIVMPKDAPQIKIEATQKFGAQTVLYDRYSESREDIAATIVAETEATLVPPYDHPHTIAGQGTVGLEIVEQLTALDCIPDAVLVPCSGGGLISGVATAIKHHFPDTQIYSVEPEGFDDTARSLASGERETADLEATSICDALLVPTPGHLTFAINKQLLSGGYKVTDTMVQKAMAFAFLQEKLVVEPGGAVALAVLLNGQDEFIDKTVVAVVSGGNVDPAIFGAAIT